MNENDYFQQLNSGLRYVAEIYTSFNNGKGSFRKNVENINYTSSIP